jgi:hypothetical protein
MSNVNRITLSPADASDAMNAAAEVRQSEAATKAENIGRDRVSHNGLDKVTRYHATDRAIVRVGGIEMLQSEAERLGLIDVNANGTITSQDPDVLEAETNIQNKEAEEQTEVEALNAVYAKGDAALDLLTDALPPAAIADASNAFVEHGDLEEIAKTVPVSALTDYVTAKTAWADTVLEGSGASVDLLSIAADEYDGQEGRLAAIRGDAMGLRRVADRVLKNIDTIDPAR